MSGEIRLDVSIGPVQGFVMQSRRTRDLWGSSYLLSYLSAQAARGVEEVLSTEEDRGLEAIRSRIVQPELERDPLFQWVKAEAKGEAGGRPPVVGSVPNHFVALVKNAELGRRAAEAAVAALQAAWRRICDAVWKAYVEEAARFGVDTAAIWRRQTEGYWEVTWTLSPDVKSGAALARRKFWRTHRLPDEPGDKCMVMPDLQELSGYVRARGERQRELQDAFWDAVRRKAGPLNLRPGDRLSAVALVKRLFVDVAEEAIGGKLDASRWPSTIDVAAAPWVERVLRYAPEKARAYAEAIKDVVPGGAFADRSPAYVEIPPGVETGRFERLYANYLHREWILDERQCLLIDDDPAVRKRLDEALRAIAEATDDAGKRLGAPSIFYTLLAADGDRLGELLGHYGPEKVSAALGRFTERVPEIVKAHKGVVVYAGGDDVLAMLPVPTALACARDLAREYRALFAEHGGIASAEKGADGSSASTAGAISPAGDEQPVEEPVATLSAAVLFAHGRVPLNAALSELRRLLDDVAKEENGRNSLAVGILKSGGMNAQWVTTWRRRRFGKVDVIDAVDAIMLLASHLDRDTADERLSTSLLYRTRETLGLLCGWHHWSPGSWGVLLERLDLEAFLKAEVVSSLKRIAKDQKVADEQVDGLVRAMLDVMERARRVQVRHGAGAGAADAVRAVQEVAAAAEGGRVVGVDGLLIARFLASRGEEEGDE